MARLSSTFWNNKKVFLTGHTGFKGAWMTMMLHQLGAEVCGYSLSADADSLFQKQNVFHLCQHHEGDIRDQARLEKVIFQFSPEIVIHMAAQSLVLEGYQSPIETFDVNVMGTGKVIQAAAKSPSCRLILNVTSDKCYLHSNTTKTFRENDHLGGEDPYSASKACAEIIGHSFHESFLREKKIKYASVRSGNVVGPGDHAKNRLVPDFFRALAKNLDLEIRNPKHVRPWMYVLDSVSAYLLFIEKLAAGMTSDESLNFGPGSDCNKSVSEVIDQLTICLSKLERQVPQIKIQQASLKESPFLSLDSERAQRALSWAPLFNFEKLVEDTVQGQLALLNGSFDSFAKKNISQFV
ncbi:MAG: CDP-glucose 4,6-dehydratase [Proteobacteria bacterium]|nr:CDP-glucose 4,6-dehydratase [Pseudomonadota bacterium]